MSKYLILSHKVWNESLLDKMKTFLPDEEWFFINSKADFTKERLDEINPEFIFIPHWSYFIPNEIYEKFKCIVFHMTDLPFGRGGSPLQNLISKGFKSTKISAIQVVKELDAGDVYLKEELSLNGTAEEIFLRANNSISKMILKFIKDKPILKKQIGEVTTFKRRTPGMSEIPNKISDIEKLYDHIRMLDAEGYPKAYIELHNFKIEFTRASLKSNENIIADVRIIKK